MAESNYCNVSSSDRKYYGSLVNEQDAFPSAPSSDAPPPYAPIDPNFGQQQQIPSQPIQQPLMTQAMPTIMYQYVQPVAPVINYQLDNSAAITRMQLVRERRRRRLT